MKTTFFLPIGIVLLMFFACDTPDSIMSDWTSGSDRDHLSSLTSTRAKHSGSENKVNVTFVAMSHLGRPYSSHYVQGGVYDLSNRSLIDDHDLAIQVGDIPLVKHSAVSNILTGFPYLLGDENPEYAAHYGQQFFGADTRIQIQTEAGAFEMDTILYIPKTLDVKSEFQSENQFLPGDRITWTPDPQCPTVLLRVVVFPIDPTRDEIDGESLYKEIKNTGSFTLTEEDWEKIPFEAPRELQFSIHQGKYYQIPGKISGETMSIGGFSEINISTKDQ